MKAALERRVGALELKRKAKAVNARPLEHVSTDDLNEMLGWVLDDQQPPNREVCNRVFTAMVKSGAMTQAAVDEVMEGFDATRT